MTLTTLRTDRLVLRALRETDAPTLTDALNDYDISRWLTVVPFPYTLDDAIWFIGENRAGRMLARAIINDGRLIGVMSLNEELGYWLAKSAWGVGFATEAAQAVLTDHFAQTDTDVVRSSHFVENQPSRNVLRKLGFVDVGPHTHFSKARQAEVAGRSMELTRDNFVKLGYMDIKPVT